MVQRVGAITGDVQAKGNKYFHHSKKKQLVFNYRLSRARRTIENTFGILANRFCVLRTPLCVRDETNAVSIIKACIALHNYLLIECPSYVQSSDFATSDDGLPEFNNELEGGMSKLPHLGRNRSGGNAAREQRERLASFFWNEGAIDYQWRIVFGDKHGC